MLVQEVIGLLHHHLHHLLFITAQVTAQHVIEVLWHEPLQSLALFMDVAQIFLMEPYTAVTIFTSHTQVVDTQVVDTQVVASDVVDTQVVVAQVVDTQVVASDVVNTQVVDTQVVDTQVVDTQVVDTQALVVVGT